MIDSENGVIDKLNELVEIVLAKELPCLRLQIRFSKDANLKLKTHFLNCVFLFGLDFETALYRYPLKQKNAGLENQPGISFLLDLHRSSY